MSSTDLSSLIGNHVDAIHATYDSLPEQKDRDLFLMGLRSALHEKLPSAMGSPCIDQDIVECIGKTKLVKLTKIQSLLNAESESPVDSAEETGEVVAKLEFTNPGSSVKDRIAKNMLLDAEREGIIKPYVKVSDTVLLLVFIRMQKHYHLTRSHTHHSLFICLPSTYTYLRSQLNST